MFDKTVYTHELEKTLRTTEWLDDLSPYRLLEQQMSQQFDKPDHRRKWREGVNKSSFTYLLLDPRITKNLPMRANRLPFAEQWKCFLAAIIYVGKGKRTRPYAHLYEAVNIWQHQNRTSTTIISKKLNRILDVWADNYGIICLHVFQNVIPVEAYTREAAMLSALQLSNVCNMKQGDFYGVAASWPERDRKLLGVYLLYKAMVIFLNEGERQLYTSDIN